MHRRKEPQSNHVQSGKPQLSGGERSPGCAKPLFWKWKGENSIVNQGTDVRINSRFIAAPVPAVAGNRSSCGC